MPRATCRCGQPLTIAADGPDRIVCPKCGARVRVRRDGAPRPADGFIRFACSCGRRLKVPASDPPKHGKCPDCGKIVPVPSAVMPTVPALPPNHPESPTAEMSAVDRAMLEEWSRRHTGEPVPGPSSTALQAVRPNSSGGRVEAGLRVCPRCRKPVHLAATVCGECGTAVPKR